MLLVPSSSLDAAKQHNTLFFPEQQHLIPFLKQSLLPVTMPPTNLTRRQSFPNLITTFFSSLKYLRPFSTTCTTQTPNFMADYLITSLGFSTAEAISASTKLTHLKTTQNPESVLNFFKQTGLDNTQIKTAIIVRPTLLSSSVSKTLKPKCRALQDLGFSGKSLGDLVIKDKFLLTRGLTGTITPCIDFLFRFLGSKEDVMKVIKRSTWLLASNTPQRMQPNISILQACGVPNKRIGKLIVDNPQCFVLKPERLERIVKKVEDEFGIPRYSWVFTHAVDVLSSLSEATIKAKFEIFERFGWSQSNVRTMTRNLPYCLSLSEEKIERGLKFLMNEVGYTAEYIASHPKLLMYSLEKRVVGRHKVLSAVKEKQLIKTNPSLYMVVCLPESKFLEEYVVKHNDDIPDICQAYLEIVKAGLQK